jgi:hypothetical protein
MAFYDFFAGGGIARAGLGADDAFISGDDGSATNKSPRPWLTPQPPRAYPFDTSANSAFTCASKNSLATISAFTASRASPPQAAMAWSVATSSRSASACGLGATSCGISGSELTRRPDNVLLSFYCQSVRVWHRNVIQLRHCQTGTSRLGKRVGADARR